MRSDLVQAISEASELSLIEVEKLFARTKELKHGDWTFPCFTLSKSWKLSPPECAKKLAQALKLPPSINRAEVTGPYLNFFVDRGQFSTATLGSILDGRETLKSPQTSKPIVLEYSSPNIAKPFHLGHLRNNLIGSCLNRLYRFLGYKVIAINHLGDWGTQFGFVYAGCKLWGRPKTESVDEIVNVYIRATKLHEEQENKSVSAENLNYPLVGELAREYFRQLEAGDPESVAFWKWCLDLSLKYFDDLYKRFNCSFDLTLGESFYRDQLPAVEEKLRASGALTESRGDLGVELEKPLGFVRIFTKDGRSLYMTRDIATALYRFQEYKPEKILHVVGDQQELYFRQLIGVLRAIKHPVAECLVHVGYGWVPGMSTRKGNTISLVEFLDEAHARAKEAYAGAVEKRPEGVDEEAIAEKVALGASYFYFLNHGKNKTFQFSWDEALTFQGDSGPYVQYAFARMRSIKKKALESGLSISTNFQGSELVDDSSHELVTLLSTRDEVLHRAAAENEPLYLTQYVLSIARVFSKAYKDLRVVGAEKKAGEARLALFAATRKTLAQVMEIIGMPVIERM